MRPGVEPLEHLANGHLFVDKPAVEHAYQRGLVLIDDQMAGHGVMARHVAIAVGRLGTEVMAIARLLQLAAAKALAQHGALVLGDGTLDLQQQLVVRVIGDRMLQEGDLTAGTAELLKQQDLVGIAPRQAIGLSTATRSMAPSLTASRRASRPGRSSRAPL